MRGRAPIWLEPKWPRRNESLIVPKVDSRIGNPPGGMKGNVPGTTRSITYQVQAVVLCSGNGYNPTRSITYLVQPVVLCSGNGYSPPPPPTERKQVVASCNAALLYAMHYPYNLSSIQQPAPPSRIRDPMGSHEWTRCFGTRASEPCVRPSDDSAGAGV